MWISVKDSFPCLGDNNYSKPVLAYGWISPSEKGQRVNWYLLSRDSACRPMYCWFNNFDVTHWMPLPAPPAEDNVEGARKDVFE